MASMGMLMIMLQQVTLDMRTMDTAVMDMGGMDMRMENFLTPRRCRCC